MEEGDSGISVALIPTASVLDYLPYCKGWLQRAAARSWNGMPYEYVRDGLVGGGMQLWVIYRGSERLAAAVTYIYKPYMVKLCRLLVLGGREADKWMPDFMESLEEFAAANECEAVEAFGRPGWRKSARRTGYGHVCSVFLKRI